jgi:hypothetical protein
MMPSSCFLSTPISIRLLMRRRTVSSARLVARDTPARLMPRRMLSGSTWQAFWRLKAGSSSIWETLAELIAMAMI